MADIEKTYYELTGINIHEQRSLWDERGKGYYGEFKVFKILYRVIEGNCKILMNLQIPASNGKTTEIDLVLIHETGVYVFEAKHYKGTIYGKDTDLTWTQYFRTASNQVFNNPIRQNQYHIEALRKMFPDLPIHSFIVFTNSECELKINNSNSNVTVCKIYELPYNLNSMTALPVVFDMEQIDKFFETLSKFSPMVNQCVTVDGVAVPFSNYIDELIQENQQYKKNLENAYTKSTNDNKKKVRKVIFVSVATCFILLMCCIIICLEFNQYCKERINIAQNELDDFASKFEHVEDFNNGNIKVSKDLIAVSEVILEESADLENTVNLSCLLTYQGGRYGVAFGKEAKIIVILKDGSVKEYDVYNTTFPYSQDYRLGKSGVWVNQEWQFPVHELYGVNISEISYIKLSNLTIWTQVDTYDTKEFTNAYEIELYTTAKK